MEELKQNPQQQVQTIPQQELERALGQEFFHWILDRAALLTQIDGMKLHLQARDQEMNATKDKILHLTRDRDRYKELFKRYVEVYGYHVHPAEAKAAQEAAAQQKGENEQPTTA